jgi:methionyl-tRNA formyltransferase
MRLIFFGSPAHAAEVLRALVADGHTVALAVTQPDRPKGRGEKLTPTPVKQAATELDIPVTHRAAGVLDVEADLGVLVAYGRIVKPDVLRHVTILNLHPSLLPRWRGATPVEAAVLAGDTKTGISVMQLVDEMDAGPVYATSEVDIEPHETSAHLYDRLFAIGTDLLLDQLRNGLSTPVAQSGDVTFCGKLTKEDFHADWTRPAVELERITRIGKMWTTFRGKRFLITEAHAVPNAQSTGPGEFAGDTVGTGDGALRLLHVQPEGKPVQNAEDWLRGARPTAADRLV